MIVAFLALAGVTLLSPAAFADGDGAVSPADGGSDVAAAGPDSAAAIAKQQMADAYYEQMVGVPGAASRFRVAAATFARFSGMRFQNSSPRSQLHMSVSPNQIPPDGGGPPPASANTGVVQKAQTTNYYCAPQPRT
jgi:hypothetical protein